MPVREPAIAITTEREVAAATQRAGATVLRASGVAELPGVLDRAPLAGTGRRFVAYLVDRTASLLVVGAALLGGAAATGLSSTDVATWTAAPQAAPVGGLVAVSAVAGGLGLVYWLGSWFWEGRTGRTLGNLVTGIRTVRAGDRAPLGFGRSALRWILTFLGALAFGVGELLVVLSPAFDGARRNQGWQDKAADALVLDARGAQGPQPSQVAAASGPYGMLAGGTAAETRVSAGRGPHPSAHPPAQPVPQGWAPSGRAPAEPVPVPGTSPDPWAFPQAGADATDGPGPLITGVPGSGRPAAPAQVDLEVAALPQGAAWTEAPVFTPAAPAEPPARQGTGASDVSAASPTGVEVDRAAASAALAATIVPVEEPDWDSTRLSAQDLRRESGSVSTVAAGVELELESGLRVAVSGSALVGRNPQTQDEGPSTLVRVDDPTRSVSKTHAELGFDASGLWVQDRGSTNGTVLARPDASPVVLEAGVRVPVPVGSVIQVGDRRIVVHPGRPA